MVHYPEVDQKSQTLQRWMRNLAQKSSGIMIKGALWVMVWQSKWIWHRYAWEHQWCTIQKLTKKSVLAMMNANTAQKSSRFKGMLLVKFDKGSTPQKSARFKGIYLITKVWQCDSGPQILKNQRGFLSEVSAIWLNLAQKYLGATKGALSRSFSDLCESGPEILKVQKDQWCLAMWMNLAQLCLGAPKVHYPEVNHQRSQSLQQWMWTQPRNSQESKAPSQWSPPVWVWPRNPQERLSVMFGDVNPHVANKYLGAPKVHYPEVDQESKSLQWWMQTQPKKSSRSKGCCR